VSEHDNPEIISFFYNDWLRSATGIAVSDGFAYISTLQRVCVVDASDSQNPRMLGDTAIRGLGTDIEANGDILYVSDRPLDNQYNPTIWTYDISDRARPQRLAAYSSVNLGEVYDIEYANGYLLVAGGSKGVRVLNVMDPEYPHEVGYFEPYEPIVSVANVGHSAVTVGRWEVGVYDYSRSLAIPQENHPVESHSFSAHPNPFNSELTISFSIVAPQNVSISLHDLNGRLISTLTDKQMQSGSHKISYDAAHLPTGLYFIRYSSHEHSSTHRIICMK